MRHITILSLAVTTFIGCQQPTNPDVALKTYEPAPEMRLLEKFVGSWQENGRIIEPTEEQIRAGLKEGEEMPPMSYTGGNVADFTLDGMYLRTDGWSDNPDGTRMTFVEYKMWDRQAKKFRIWWFSSNGMYATGWMTPNADGRTFDIKAQGFEPDGTTKQWTGSLTFSEANKATWIFVERGPQGVMKMEGENERQI